MKTTTKLAVATLATLLTMSSLNASDTFKTKPAKTTKLPAPMEMKDLSLYVSEKGFDVDSYMQDGLKVLDNNVKIITTYINSLKKEDRKPSKEMTKKLNELIHPKK